MLYSFLIIAPSFSYSVNQGIEMNIKILLFKISFVIVGNCQQDQQRGKVYHRFIVWEKSNTVCNNKRY